MRRLLTSLLALVCVLALGTTAYAAKPGSKLIQFKSGGYSTPENKNGSIAITLSQRGTASVQLSTIGGTANPSDDATCSGGEDYIPTPPGGQTVSFSNQTGTNATIQICANNRHENSETVALQLNTPSSGWSLGPKQTATLTINDDDPKPVITIDDESPAVTEGGDLVFDVHVAGNSAVPASVNYAAQSGPVPAATAGADFPSTTGSLSWGPGDTSDRQITVPATDDAVDELTENVRMQLSNPINASFGDNNAAGQIADNDDPPTINAGDGAGDEGDPNAFLVTLSGPAAVETKVDWITAANGSASATGVGVCGDPGIDYESASGTLTFAPGDVSEPVSITTCEDADLEGEETFTLNLSNPVYSSIGTTPGVGRIGGDGDTDTFTVTGAGFAVPDGGSTSSNGSLGSPLTGVTITDVDLSVEDLDHDSWLPDFDAVLAGPTGASTAVFSDIGQSAVTVTDHDFVFDDEGAAYVCGDALSASPSTYAPTNCAGSSDDASVTGADATLGVFDGTNPYGTWSLTVFDDEIIDSGAIGGWTATLQVTD